ncbi:hypothetical protein LG311_04745 [Sutcliffiella horikoshii]|uniref:hypothetical protein n=1 Tax=Sutcliffiella horikoshii TaxID=79883 RepID=UPI003850A71B
MKINKQQLFDILTAKDPSAFEVFMTNIKYFSTKLFRIKSHNRLKMALKRYGMILLYCTLFKKLDFL